MRTRKQMRNKEVDYISRKIMQLASCIDLGMISSLLIIRYVSRGFTPAYVQLRIEQYLADGYENTDTYEQTAWDIVVNAKSGAYIPAIIEALRSIMPQHPLMHCLEEAICDVKPDEQVLREMIELLSNIVLDDAALARIYEYRLGREMCKGSSLLGDFYTPYHIARLLFDLLDMKDGSVYDPCCGSGSILYRAGRSAVKLQLYGQTANMKSYQICQMYSFLHKLSVNLGDKPANTLTEDLHINRKFDYISANIPFNLSHWRDENTCTGDARWQYGIPPESNANFAWVQHIISHLAQKGRAVVLLPNGSLTTQIQTERKIRQGLLEDGLIEAIIALPSKIFYSTDVPCCIWILNKARTSGATTLVIDARSLKLGEDNTAAQEIFKLNSLVLRHREGALKGKTNWYAVISPKEISQKKYTLSPNLYTRIRSIPISPIRQNQARFTVLIDQLCLQLKDSTLLPYIRQWKDMRITGHWEKAALLDLYQPFGGLAKNKEFFGCGTKMVDVKTVIHHSFLPDSLSTQVEVEATEEEIKKYQIKAGDILLNRSSESIEQLACCCIVPEDRCMVYGSYIKCLRSKKDEVPNPFYMAGYFRSAVYRHEVERVSPVYTTRANMNVDRLSEILVYYPDVDTQDKLGETLFAIFQYQKADKDKALNQSLTEFKELLIEQFITYPILYVWQNVCLQKREDNDK